MNRACITFASLFTLITILSGIGLVCSSANADDSTVSTVTVSVDVACSLTSTEDTPHTTSIPNGTYRADIGTTTLKVLCNDSGGFAVYAIGYSGLEFGNNKMLATVDGNLAPTYDIITGTAENGDTSNWAMKLNKVTDTTTSYSPNNLTIDNSFDSYHTVPTTYTKVATYNSVTDAILGSKLTTTYAAYIAGTQPAGTYEGKVKYTLVHPSTETPLQPQTPTAGCINYFANASNAVGTMGCQNQNDYNQNITDGSTVTLLASNFSRDGYGFAGWSDKFDYATNPNAHFYGPQEDITVPEGTTANGLALYAVWIKSQGSLQDSNKVASVCSNLTTAPTDGTANLTSVSALTDQRDNNTYAIAKLADGKCWMIENMRLENTGTDNTNGSLAQGYNASFAGLANPEAPWANNSTIANSLYSTDGSTDKTISDSNQRYRFPRYNNVNTPTTATDRPSNPTSNSATNSTTNASMYSYGNYYTWAAAIADTTDYTTNNQSVTSTSVCPTGWSLPKGGNKSNEANNDFWALVVTGINGGTNPANYDSSTAPSYSGTPEGSDASNALRAYPNNFVYSGFVSSGSVGNRGSYGYYWSSTAYSGSSAYYMYFFSSYVYPGTYNFGSKYNGRNFRCLASGA